ncbi:unnamed protein product [Arctogadus glacialis]
MNECISSLTLLYGFCVPGADSSTAAPAPRPIINHLPARLTDRHFLAKRLWGSVGCVVCGHRPRKRATEEEEEQEEGPWGRKRGRTEESKEESGTVRVAETEKGDEKGDEKEAETLEHERHREEEEEAVQAEREETKAAGLETGVGVAGQGATDFYCRLCPGQPGLCAAPCFELYHTRLMYWVSPGGGVGSGALRGTN